MDQLATTHNSDIIRVMLWSVPRSVSTAFLKCMTYVPNSQVWFEPYWMTVLFSKYGRCRVDLIQMLKDSWGASKVNHADTDTFGSDIPGGYFAGDKSHSWIKSQLETVPPENKTFVFGKDFSAGLDGKFENIPDGFRHSFLIRHPYIVFDSWDRMLNRPIDDKSKRMKLSELPEYLLPPGLYFKEQYDHYQYVKEHYEPNPIIIDTDDLLADPGRVLKAYCEAVGIPYSDDLLQWKPGRECMDEQWMIAKEQILAYNFGNHHASTFASTCFGKASKLLTRGELSDDVLHCSDISMDYYDAMYANRLQV